MEGKKPAHELEGPKGESSRRPVEVVKRTPADAGHLRPHSVLGFLKREVGRI